MLFKKKPKFINLKEPFIIIIFVIAIAFILLMLSPLLGQAQLNDIARITDKARKVTIADETIISETKKMIKVVSTNDEVAELIIKKYSNDISTYDIRYFLMKAKINKLQVYKSYTIYLNKECKEEIIEYFKQLNYQ